MILSNATNATQLLIDFFCDITIRSDQWSILFLVSSFLSSGAYPPPMGGGVPPPWPPMMDNSKPWDYYSRREDKRDKDRERPRERTHEREREREHSPSAMGYTR